MITEPNDLLRLTKRFLAESSLSEVKDAEAEAETDSSFSRLTAHYRAVSPYTGLRRLVFGMSWSQFPSNCGVGIAHDFSIPYSSLPLAADYIDWMSRCLSIGMCMASDVANREGSVVEVLIKKKGWETLPTFSNPNTENFLVVAYKIL